MSKEDSLTDHTKQEDCSAASSLISLIYDDLRRLAQHRLSQEKPGQTLQATALVHEVWLRLDQSARQEWRGREHFFCAAAEAMRRILVENARRKLRLRRGGRRERVDCEVVDLPIAAQDQKCLQIDEVLDRLALSHSRKAEVVKMRIFVGLEFTEIATALNVSEKTVQRDWTFAKAWLSRELLREEEKVSK